MRAAVVQAGRKSRERRVAICVHWELICSVWLFGQWGGAQCRFLEWSRLQPARTPAHPRTAPATSPLPAARASCAQFFSPLPIIKLMRLQRCRELGDEVNSERWGAGGRQARLALMDYTRFYVRCK